MQPIKIMMTNPEKNTLVIQKNVSILNPINQLPPTSSQDNNQQQPPNTRNKPTKNKALHNLNNVHTN
jgi:hypothetical protein